MGEHTHESSLSQPDILVVDDTLENLKVLVGMLGNRGYRVRPVPCGSTALQVARAKPPDLILLDIQMPDMDGYEVCQALKQDPLLAPIPVIFLSAFTEPVNKVKAFEVGGVDYVSKPFSIEEVLARVGTHLKLQRDERELRASYERLRELEKLRDSLVHMLVHDLRSPLSGIIFFLQSLKDDAVGILPADSMGDMEKALTASQRMIQLVNAMLDVNKLEAGQMKLCLSECDLRQIAKEAIASLKGLARNRNLLLEASEPAIAWADGELLFRVFQNLISNALKFTPAGSDVQVETGSDGEWAHARITDNGSGIPKDLQERVFEKFGQAGEPVRKGMFSTGLGLPFCKLAIEAHGGNIGVDSEPGQGSSFWLRVPKGVPIRS